MSMNARARQSFTRRALLLGAAQGGVGLLLAARLTQLAVGEGDKYKLLAEGNRAALRLIPPRRGWIVDRAAKPLAMNRPDYRLELTADEAGDVEAVLARLTALLALEPDEVGRIRDDLSGRPGYMPVSVKDDIPWASFAGINVRLPELPGVRPVRGFARTYPGGAAYGHLLGYMAAPSHEEYARTKDKLLLQPGFKVGKEGVEKALDARLRGKPGARREEVTASGRPVRELDTVPDAPGETVRLTIDRDLQDYAARRIGAEAASIVLMDCWTGDILAMLSMPAYDPNAFSDGISQAEWAAMQGDLRHPLINKCVGGVYPPGSTFKPVTALAILGAGISPDAAVNCHGSYRFGGHDFHCHIRRGHGHTAMLKGLTQSCDVYFYNYGHEAGIDAIAKAGRELGLGARYELPIGGQRKGIIPDQAWKMARYDKRWLPGETLSCAIGQGYVAANPLQLAVMTSRIASGRAIEPRLVMAGAPPSFAPLSLPPEHLAIVRQGMIDVVNQGTAKKARLTGEFQMAGKTGTAQVRQISAAERRHGVRKDKSLAWEMRDHAWFICYAPADAPRYAMSVLIEHGGHGGVVCAPIARDLMTYLFEPGAALASLARVEAELARSAAADLVRAQARAREAARAAAAAQAQDPVVASVAAPIA